MELNKTQKICSMVDELKTEVHRVAVSALAQARANANVHL